MPVFRDEISLQRVEKLHPLIRESVLAALEKCWSSGLRVRITQGLRTIAEQNSLYSIGRTSPGRVVTNAKGGHSYHNYGLAVDFCLIRYDKSASFSETEDVNRDGRNDWPQVVEIFKAEGFEWGGDFKSIRDTPHFQKSFGKSTAELLALVKLGEIYPSLT